MTRGDSPPLPDAIHRGHAVAAINNFYDSSQSLRAVSENPRPALLPDMIILPHVRRKTADTTASSPREKTLDRAPPGCFDVPIGDGEDRDGRRGGGRFRDARAGGDRLRPHRSIPGALPAAHLPAPRPRLLRLRRDRGGRRAHLRARPRACRRAGRRRPPQSRRRPYRRALRRARLDLFHARRRGGADGRADAAPPAAPTCRCSPRRSRKEGHSPPRSGARRPPMQRQGRWRSRKACLPSPALARELRVPIARERAARIRASPASAIFCTHASRSASRSPISPTPRAFRAAISSPPSPAATACRPLPTSSSSGSTAPAAS
jgi:hypothetical protein